MIKMVVKIKNIGLFRHACPKGAVVFDQTTAVYADNAMGKSTFATVLRACQMSDATRLVAKRTIDVTDEPEVELLLDNNKLRKYENGAWIGTIPDISVFDSEFVEKNVYSGFSVRADQRQGLLDFALGDTIIPMKNLVDKLSKKIQKQTTNIGYAEKLLRGFAAPLDLQQFIDLEPIAYAEELTSVCQTRIGAARNAQILIARSDPTALNLVDFDLRPIFNVLSRQLADIENTAEATVKAHLDRHGVEGFEDWISQGQPFLGTVECPFCGQSVTSQDLIAAYRSYFNKAYQDLKDEVTKLETKIMSSFADSIADSAAAMARTNAARIDAWKDQLEIDPPRLNGDALKEMLVSVRNVLIPLAQRKHANPLDAVGASEDAKAAEQYIAEINKVLTDYNLVLAAIAQKISEFKNGLKTEDTRKLETELIRLQASIKRQGSEVVQAHADYQSATAKKRRLELKKSDTREQIDARMHETLTSIKRASIVSLRHLELPS